ncbi:hypothetical protein [Aurantibacillus circumpalustris]|uniref:hypothetical protein n=1 Tax=Aurantibacillus circumpalustris TaxID=3036359 RepID=UPI00295C2E68|nr:hypothetical protein [Aurantibacillus circumpalustris]
MKKRVSILITVFAVFSGSLLAQTVAFREGIKWGVKENESVIIQPIYDTIFDFDSTGKICMACFRIKSASANKFIKVTTTSFACNYLSKKNERLIIRNQLNDTSSIFSYSKSILKQYLNNDPYFMVTWKGKKFIVYKSFQQLTFKGYHDISFSPEKKFYFTSFKNEGDIVLAGITNEREEELIPHNYSIIKINTNDSLIVACSAGVRNNADDEVFDYHGKKVIGTHRHIDIATKHFLIHKIYEPKEYYILYNMNTKEETTVHADEIMIYEHDEILLRQKKEWFIYDLNTNIKRPYKHS